MYVISTKDSLFEKNKHFLEKLLVMVVLKLLQLMFLRLCCFVLVKFYKYYIVVSIYNFIELYNIKLLLLTCLHANY